jgi:hypothetical protein
MSGPPALMTSFGDGQSDGLLTFSEIFDLKIDADLVILSACDTAGKASVAQPAKQASPPAATSLSTVSSAPSWAPAAAPWSRAIGRCRTITMRPKRLISGLFTAAPGTATATALRSAQTQLMSQPETSHPYYWSGFAIIGDGAAPVIPAAEGGAKQTAAR